MSRAEGPELHAARMVKIKVKELLGGLPIGRSTKVIDGQHPAGAATPARDESLKPDLLPLSDEQNGHHGPCKRNVLVAVAGSELDREVMTLACEVARKKKSQVFAVFGIQVPRTKAIDDEMPAETHSAHDALDHVTFVAGQMGTDIEPEIVQSRDFGRSLVDEAEAHECALLIMGLPYRLGVEGQLQGAEALDYVLRNAPCKVWIVRGQPPEKAEQPGQTEPERSAVTR